MIESRSKYNTRDACQRNHLDRFSMSRGKCGCGLFSWAPSGPAGLGGLKGYCAALLSRHGLQSAFSADFTALSTHLGHDEANHTERDSFAGLNGFHNDSAGVLNSIDRFVPANPIRHASTMPRVGACRQEARCSNRPTTEVPDQARLISAR